MEDQTQYKTADAPFNDPPADIILITADNVLFRLNRVIMANASPVFENMLAMPHPPPSDNNTGPLEYIHGLPVVRVANNAVVMDRFFRCCYPGIAHPRLSHTQDALELRKAGDMYMNEAVQSYCTAEFKRIVHELNLDVHENAIELLRGYAGAYKMGLKEETAVAARASLKCTVSNVFDICDKYLRESPASLCLNLMRYHEDCKSAAFDLLSPRCKKPYGEVDLGHFPPLWDVDDNSSLHNKACEVSLRDYTRGVVYDEGGPYTVDVVHEYRRWFTDYKRGIQDTLKRNDFTIHQALHEEDVFQKAIVQAMLCSRCAQDAVKSLLKLSHLVDSRLERCLDGVTLRTD